MEHLIIIKFVQIAHRLVEIAKHLPLTVQLALHPICRHHLVYALVIQGTYGVLQVVWPVLLHANFVQVNIIIIRNRHRY